MSKRFIPPQKEWPPKGMIEPHGQMLGLEHYPELFKEVRLRKRRFFTVFTIITHSIAFCYGGMIGGAFVALIWSCQ